MTKRGRPDLLSFLTTLVNCPTGGKLYKKLKIISLHLNATKNLILILKAILPFQLHSYVDALYAAHVDSKGRT